MSVSVNVAGYVTRVWNVEAEWVSQSASDVVIDLELGIHSYFVRWPEANVQIVAADDEGGRFLIAIRPGAQASSAQGNSLLDLPRHDA